MRERPSQNRDWGRSLGSQFEVDAEEATLTGGLFCFPSPCGQPVSRILSGFASETAIPLGAPLLTRSSNLPGGFRQGCSCEHPRSSRGRAGPARMADRWSRARHSLPIWSCSVWGLPCHWRCRQRGALLPHLFTLTSARGLRPGRWRYLLCGTGRIASLDARTPDVIRHTALRSSDFPLPIALARARQRPSSCPHGYSTCVTVSR